MDDRLVALSLTCHAGAHTWQGLATASRDSFAAVFAMIESLSCRYARASATDGVVHRIVDLILNRTVT